MDTQNQVKRKLSDPKAIAYIAGLLKESDFDHRSELAGFLCEHFGFYDPRGREQRMGCLKALRELEAAGHFTLPAAQTTTGPKTPRRLSEAVAEPTGVPATAGEVEGLTLLLVSDTEHMRVWNEMMIREHPRGHGPLVGRQIRYLVGSAYGWLGAFGFAAPALYLVERDRWIGWNDEQRRSCLHAVVNMSRFLIRPSVRCANLASRLLAMAVQRLPDDFERCYGYRPLLVESFVDRARFEGTCYRAANWILVGQTQGRGRQDRLMEAKETVKDIYVYPLEKDFRVRLGLAADAGRIALGAADGLEADTWAEKEFGGAPLGDTRLSRRLVKAAEAKADEPWRAFSGIAKGDWAAVKGYYRMIDMPEDSAVTMANILKPHRERTVRRMQGQRTVLCVQDGSDLDYNHVATCEGLGEIGTNQTGTSSRGLHLHSTLAIAPNGLPLGVLRAGCVAPKSKSPEEERPSFAIPIEEKKNFTWIEHHRDMVELAAGMPHTHLIDVCDREADFFELFDEQRRNPSVDLLVRAHHNRHITEGSLKLFEAVRQAPAQSRVRVDIPRQSARPKRSKQLARPKRPGRIADMTVRYLRIQLRPSHYHADKLPMDIWVIHALEENPSSTAKAVEWFLLTTIDIVSAEDAEQCLRWYCLRWRIEDWHRVLKSGCRVEDIAHASAERLRRAIAINLVVAWRIMLMTLLGRETPDLPAEVLFSDVELKTLRA
ncbi:MAG: IS4 family transposase, partial [Holophaga sp.]|nr:IS4 family transposase [Holophaga sp.]